MNNSIPNQGGNLFPIGKAKEMIAKYIENKNTILSTEYKNSDVLANSETFNADDVRLLLSQPGCVGFRVLYGMDNELKIHSILVGVNSEGNEILIKDIKSEVSDEDGYVLEDAIRCPPLC
jgi:hypothetical protein